MLLAMILGQLISESISCGEPRQSRDSETRWTTTPSNRILEVKIIAAGGGMWTLGTVCLCVRGCVFAGGLDRRLSYRDNAIQNFRPGSYNGQPPDYD